MSSENNHLPSSCKLLDDNVRNAIRSGMAITSVTQCVEELVLNSIDADAGRISIQVDLSEFKLKVEDDGQGIKRNDLEVIGTHYMTSKCHTMSDLLNLKHYGYRGEALASIINVSTSVEIISRAQSDQEPYSRKFKEGVSSGSVRRVSGKKHSSHGVTVTVDGFLAKLPVRQKQITPLEIEKIKKILMRIYLMNSRVQIDFKHMGMPILHTLGTNSVTDAFQFLYKKVLIEAFSSYDVFYFQAWFSKELCPAKSFQFVYVNNRITSRNKIHRAMDELIGCVLGVGRKGGSPEQKSGQGQGQGAKYPIFVLNILTPLTEYDITLEPAKTLVEFKNWDRVLKGIETLGFRFKVALEAESRNGLVMDWMRKAESTGGEAGVAGHSSFGKSISTRTLTSAVHSRFATRVAHHSTLPLDLTNSQRHTETLGFEETSYADDAPIREMHRSHSDPAVRSKMAKFRSPDRPKFPLQAAAAPFRYSSSQEVAIPSKKISIRQSKRNADEPLFPRGYNSKRLRICPPIPQHPCSPTLMSRIKEKFPIFREDSERTDEGQPWQFKPTTPPIPSPVLFSELRTEISYNPLDSPFQRLSLTKHQHAEILSEGIWDLPETGLEPSTSPIIVSDDHFFGVVDDRFNKLLKEFKIPDMAKQSAELMLKETEKENEKKKKQEPAGSVEQPVAGGSVPSSVNSAGLYDPSPSHIGEGHAESLRQDDYGAGGTDRIPLVVSTKSVAEIVEMVLEKQRRSNTAEHTYSSNPSQNKFQESHTGSTHPCGDREIQVSQYWQHSGPMESRIPSLDRERTTSAECRFVKEDLRNMRVIGQVDNKFIAAKSVVNGKESLVLFDQHAVHERIRLEILLEEIRENGNSPDAVAARIKRIRICPPLELELTDTEIRVVNLYRSKFDMIGIQVEVPRNLSNLVFVHTAPLCFVERVNSEPRQNRDEKIVQMIQHSIQQQVRHIVETSGNVQLIPQETFEILCTQACHGAIKFGDPLDLETCKDLLGQLAHCKAPFQCAHGRPSLTPLLDLTSLPETEAYRAEIPCLVR